MQVQSRMAEGGEARGKGGDSADRAGRGRGGEIGRGEDLS